MSSRAARASGRVAAVARKEFRQLGRDRLTLAMIVGIPTLQLILFGYAIDLDVRGVPTALLDRSRSTLSRQLVGRLEATQTFRVVHHVGNEREIWSLLEQGRIGAAIVIPPDLDRRLHRGRGAEVSVLTDGSNPTVAAAVATAGRGLGAELALRYQPVLGGRAEDVQAGAIRAPPLGRARFGPEPRLVRAASMRIAVIPFYNPERRTAVFIVPGLVGVILTMTMMLMTALAVVRERERGTFEFLIATPVGPTEVMVGKILPYLLVGLAQVTLILMLGAWLFDVPLRGSLLDLGAAALVFIAAMLAMGLVISSAAETQFQAMQMSFFFFLPSMLLSGFMFPFESMPEPAQWIGQALPLTHFLRIVRGILLKGASLEVLWGEIAAIGLFLAVAMAIAAASFRKRLG